MSFTGSWESRGSFSRHEFLLFWFLFRTARPRPGATHGSLKRRSSGRSFPPSSSWPLSQPEGLKRIREVPEDPLHRAHHRPAIPVEDPLSRSRRRMGPRTTTSPCSSISRWARRPGGTAGEDVILFLLTSASSRTRSRSPGWFEPVKTGEWESPAPTLQGSHYTMKDPHRSPEAWLKPDGEPDVA